MRAAVALVVGAVVVLSACGLEVRELNGTHVMHVDSVNYVMANDSFSLTAPVLIVRNSGTFQVGAEGAGKLLLINILEGQSGNVMRWARTCEAIHCAGIVYYNLDDYNSAVEFTWVYRVGPTIPFTKVPIVLIGAKAGVTAVPFLLSRQTPFAMTVESGAYNEGSSFIAPICYVFYVPCFLLSFLNAALVIYQLSRFLVSETGEIRRVPKYPLMAMSTEFVATMMRCIYFGNALFSKSQGIDFGVWRYTTLSCISWSFMGTAAVAFGLHEMLFAGHPDGMPLKQKILSRTLATFLFVIFVFEELSNIMPAFFYVNIINNVTYFAVLYFFFYLPISFSFIKYGRQISRELLKMKGSLSKLEAAKRKRFARRVVQSGVLGFAIDLASLFIVFTNGISITVSIVGYTINLILMAIAGALHVLSFVPGPSKMDLMTNSLLKTTVWYTSTTKSQNTKNQLSTSKPKPATTAQGLTAGEAGTQL